MLNERISEALGDISDELLVSAMQPGKKRRQRTYVDLAVAALAAASVLVLLVFGLRQSPQKALQTAPGVITVLAHELDDSGKLTDQTQVLEEGEIFEPQKQQQRNENQIFPLSFLVDESQYPGMDLQLQVAATVGIFTKNELLGKDAEDLPEALRLLLQHYGQQYEADIGENIYWQTDGFDYLFMQQQTQKGNYDLETVYRDLDFEKGPSYILVTLQADEHIVGFCHIKITLADPSVSAENRQFRFQIIASVSYPQVDGQWQDVSEEDVHQHMHQELEKLKDELEDLDQSGCDHHTTGDQ